MNVSFQLERGQTLGIVGRTGSGKSTLLKQLLRQYPIDRSKLFISDVPIEQIAMDQMKHWVAYVPQEHLLLSKSIRDNIALGKPDATAGGDRTGPWRWLLSPRILRKCRKAWQRSSARMASCCLADRSSVWRLRGAADRFGNSAAG